MSATTPDIYECLQHARWECCYVPGCSDFAVGSLRRLPPWRAIPSIRARVEGCDGSSFGVATLAVRHDVDDREAFERWLESMPDEGRSWPWR